MSLYNDNNEGEMFDFEEEVTAADKNTLSNRVASLIVGDLKRIKSTVKAWKGKMKDSEYKEFVLYQASVGDFIAKSYMKKLPKEYVLKAKAIK